MRLRPTPGRVLTVFVSGMLFVLAIINSVMVTVAWWQGRLEVPGIAEWFWIGALPVLIYVYLQYFSVLACAVAQPL